MNQFVKGKIHCQLIKYRSGHAGIIALPRNMFRRSAPLNHSSVAEM
jgi:hypothetical protein